MTYFSMLATDWVYDNNNKNPQVRLRPQSLWDDLLSRHQRECDDLVRLEEKHGNKLKRVASTETVRDSLTGRGDTAATSGKFIPGYSQQALQKKRRIDSGQEARESSSSASSSISDSLSVPPSIAVQEQELVASTSRDMHSHSHEPVLRHEAYVSLRSLRRRKSSDSHLSTASESSFSDISISSTSDWEMLEGESIGQYLKVEDTATTT